MTKRLSLISRIKIHLITITRHKFYVFQACWKSGLYRQAFTHDLSKYTLRELREYVKFTDGVLSPIVNAKEQQGYIEAWLWHRGRNAHHHEFWIDEIEKGGIPLVMPYKYVMELVCDWIGAGKSYEKTKWHFGRPYEYWKKYVKDVEKIHPMTANFLENIFMDLDAIGWDALDKTKTKKIYDYWLAYHGTELQNELERKKFQYIVENQAKRVDVI